MSTEFRTGARVWYQPAEGLQFAGIIMGPGSLPDTNRVLLTGHYWRWKGRKGNLLPAEQPAISTFLLHVRYTDVPHLDLDPRALKEPGIG